MRKSYLTFGVVLVLLLISRTSHAQERACDELGMGVVYKDSLYGIGTGVILTGLTMVAVDRFDHGAQKLAAGGLVGAGVGLAIGVIEVFSRNCERPASTRAGWKLPTFEVAPSRAFAGSGLAAPNLGINLTYVIGDLNR